MANSDHFDILAYPLLGNAVRDWLIALAAEQDRIRFDRAHFLAYGDYALNFEIVYYVLAPDYNLYMDIQQAINLRIHERFEQEGVDFAYPTQTIYVNQLSNGSRSDSG
jgi:small-conductance mechanosensitive channel